MKLFQSQKSNCRLIPDIQNHMIIRIKQFVPPTDFGRRSFPHQLHIPMRTIRTRIFLIMLVQQEYSRIYILQSKFIIFIHISKIGGIRIIRRCIQ